MKQQYITICFALIIMFLGVFAISQNWKMIDYTTMIDELTEKLTFTENKLNNAEERVFNLGDGLWNKQHIYDLKFVIRDDGKEYEFYAHKYILMKNSKYFENLLSNESIELITYNGISKSEFNSVMELLYSGKFKTSISLSQLPHIFEYMDKFLVSQEYTDYLDSYFTSRFNKCHNETFDVGLISDIYDIARLHNLNNLRNTILKNIYNTWKFQLLNKQHIANHSALFFDYIKLSNCVEDQISFN